MIEKKYALKIKRKHRDGRGGEVGEKVHRIGGSPAASIH